MKKSITLIMLIFLVCCGHSLAQKAAAARDVYHWDEFDEKASSVKKNAIDFRMLQGTWFAYEGWYYGDDKKFWKDYNNPRVFLIKGNLYRGSAYGKAFTYKLSGNLLLLETEEKTDSAYINLLTDTKLTISFKRGEDYESYLFEK